MERPKKCNITVHLEGNTSSYIFPRSPPKKPSAKGVRISHDFLASFWEPLTLRWLLDPSSRWAVDQKPWNPHGFSAANGWDLCDSWMWSSPKDSIVRKFGAIIVFGPHDSYDQNVNNLEREEMPLFGISKLMCSSNVLSLILVKDRNQQWAYA